MIEIPRKSKSVVLSSYNHNLIRAIIGIKVEERPLPELSDNEVLIKMKAAPCNPSDIAFIRGGYNIIKSLPAVPGFEGAGKVIDAGKDNIDLIGKRVCYYTSDDTEGTWSEYFITSAENCIVLKDGISYEQGSCLSINPFTAYGLFEIVINNRAKAIIQNGAGGQVTEFVRVLSRKQGIAVINIVRKEEQVTWLREKGEKLVLNSTDENFSNSLKKLANDLNATIAFDSVGGEDTGVIMNALPENSTVVVLGGLSGKGISGIDPIEVIFKNKKVTGFNLNFWMLEKSVDEFERISNEIQDMIIREEIKTEIQGTCKLDDVVNGIRLYIKSMSKGKIIFQP